MDIDEDLDQNLDLGLIPQHGPLLEAFVHMPKVPKSPVLGLICAC